MLFYDFDGCGRWSGGLAVCEAMILFVGMIGMMGMISAIGSWPLAICWPNYELQLTNYDWKKRNTKNKRRCASSTTKRLKKISYWLLAFGYLLNKLQFSNYD